MRLKSSKILYAYWEELRGSRIAPRRFEIEPSRIADVLPDTFILERTALNRYRFRLAGTRVCDRLGAQFRGVDFLRCWSKDGQPSVLRGLSTVAMHGAVFSADVVANYTEGQSTRFEMLLLPLVHTDNTVDRFMGVISSLETSKATEGGTFVSLELINSKLHWPSKAVNDPILDSADGHVGSANIFEPHVRSARVVRHARRSFRVYEGGLSDQNKGK